MKLLKYIVLVTIVNLFVCSIPLQADESGANEPVFRIGIFPRRDPLITIRMFKPLQDYLQAQLSMRIELETAANFKRFEANLNSGKYDLVHFNQCHYIDAHEQHNYEVIAQNEEFGEKSIRGAIYARKDSGITSLEELRGKTIVFGGGEKAMISYVVPRFLLQQADLFSGDYQERFAKSPPNAVLAVYQKQVEAGGAGAVVSRLPLITDKIDVSQLIQLAQSKPLSHLPWAVKGDMSEALKNKLRETLLSLKDTDVGKEILESARLTALNPAVDDDYDEHRAIINAITNDSSGAGEQ